MGGETNGAWVAETSFWTGEGETVLCCSQQSFNLSSEIIDPTVAACKLNPSLSPIWLLIYALQRITSSIPEEVIDFFYQPSTKLYGLALLTAAPAVGFTD